MKKIVLTIIISLFSVLYVAGSTYDKIDMSGESPRIENISAIKLYTPATVMILDNPKDSTYFNIRTSDKYLYQNLKYDIKDSILEIKLKHGNYDDYQIDENDIKIIVGNRKDLKIIPSNDLIINKTFGKKYYQLNNENQN